ncbi:pyocin knob domain-containing S74 family peptidase [Sinorhizobium medicae]|uniref:pyocin knob domain-containing S74 family peptidase n=1 Tax=Sinorhizobium medicae TaxID=110321 RepID=UPI002AF6B386|nr:pyocin knob domain-containing S74 family peptidase [Sinorhizobium medicae]WQO47241.1 pyocin knob domain-containing S74 family peptidase [Sinorhizobium medicae]WQO74601.1 pyocin knob domain-containing S74 family peptidase [Sinorhizobium medicae]WQO90517.1 pyocin knob domain-containing S74 family peptidase [Sinorhizobium medicae]
MTIPYVTGTVSVTAGSAVVTGSGTAWATALIAGGIFGLDSSNGNPVPILSVDSNTQLTLAKPWRGTTAAGQGYWIIRDTAYLQQQTVNAQALSTYIQRLDNGTLTALAEITGAANRVPYFTSAQAMSLVPLQSGLGDATANALMKVGAFGLGALSLQGGMPFPNVMLNDLTNVYTGFYYVSASAGQGGPLDPAGSFGSMIVLRRTSQIAHQIMTTSTVGDPRTFTRVTIDGGTTWGAWVETLTTNDAGARGLAILAAATGDDMINAAETLFGGRAPVPSSAGLGLTDGDFDTLVKPGVFTIAGAFANGPSGAPPSTYTGLVAIHRRVFNNSTYQMLFLNNSIWVRAQNTAPTWLSWERLSLASESALLAVQNTFAATQSINAGGSYVQWALTRSGVVGSYEAGTNFVGIGSASDHPLVFKANALERARFEPTNGDFLVGLTSTIDPASGTTTGFAIRGNTGRAWRRASGYNPFYQTRLATDGVLQEFYREHTAVGSISVTSTTTTYATSSDHRLKNDVQPIVEFSLTPEQFDVLDNAELKIMALQPVFHRWNDAPEKGVVTGFIAHEAQQIVPHAVTGEKDGMVDIGREIIPAHDIEVEDTDNDGKPLTKTVTIPEQINEGVRVDGLEDGATFEKTGEMPVYQTMDYGLITADIVAALQCVIYKNMLQGEEIASLKAANADMASRLSAIEQHLALA